MDKENDIHVWKKLAMRLWKIELLHDKESWRKLCMFANFFPLTWDLEKRNNPTGQVKSGIPDIEVYGNTISIRKLESSQSSSGGIWGNIGKQENQMAPKEHGDNFSTPTLFSVF